MKTGYIILWAAAALAPCLSFAVSDANTYVTVVSSTTGVEGIYAVEDDFYVTTRGVCSPPFAAEMEITANSPWRLKEPTSRHLRLAIGEDGEYKVEDGSGTEEGPKGNVYVLKLDIEQTETNVCWKSTSCALNLTDDSYTGGGVEWTSNPSGISGRGRSITFNPSLLDPGEYVVTARTDVVHACTDTCVVRIVKLVTETFSPIPSNKDRTRLGIAENVICRIIPGLDAQWSVDGAGRIVSSSGAMNLFEAGNAQGDAILHARVPGADCAVHFEVVQPSGMRVFLSEDNPLGTPGCSEIGACSTFDCLVLPDDVSFYNVHFRENIPGESFKWPDGSSDSRPATIVPWRVGYDNRTQDNVGGFRHAVNKLLKDGNYVNFTIIVRVPSEFESGSGNWIVWAPEETHPRKFRGTDKKAAVGIRATNEVFGGWMGPWE